MAKLNLNLPIVDETGSQVTPERTVGQTLAFTMIKSVNEQEGDIIKFFDWAQKLGSNKVLEIDEGDVKKLKDFVLKNKELFIIVKAPILKALDKIKF